MCIRDRSGFLLIYAKDIGLSQITGVKADIGKLRAAYATTSSTATWSFAQNKAGAFGHFTDNSNGLQVNNTFRIYNADAALRDKTNGDVYKRQH